LTRVVEHNFGVVHFTIELITSLDKHAQSHTFSYFSLTDYGQFWAVDVFSHTYRGNFRSSKILFDDILKLVKAQNWLFNLKSLREKLKIFLYKLCLTPFLRSWELSFRNYTVLKIMYYNLCYSNIFQKNSLHGVIWRISMIDRDFASQRRSSGRKLQRLNSMRDFRLL
jgi:succinate-acetate transporter protein